ncbi:MAG: family 1 glycosylhydrolase [Eubacteriales bacterium]|nr:family 1 glycosylhydrolase [Eubacteriales bacterium]
MSDIFFVGAATAAHQVEGNNIHSDYWAMEHAEFSQFTEPSDAAVDHYNRYEEDIKMLKNAGLNAYRFSIEWARIEPEKDHFDASALEHYRNVIRCCRENEVEPIVTLFHFTSPKWLICEGGWDNEAVIERFALYVKYVVEELKDELSYVCTINEANMRLQIRAIMERFMKMMQSAPKTVHQKNPKEGREEKTPANNSLEGQVQVGLNMNDPMEKMKLAAMENAKIFGDPQPHTFVSAAGEQGDEIVCLAHRKAVEIIKEIAPAVKVGITLSLHDMQSVPGGEQRAQKEWDEEFTHYIPFIKEDDFLGLQNYSRSIYSAEGICAVPENAKKTQMDYENYPEALEHVIRRVNREMPGVDILVTENGIAVSDDTERVEFIRKAAEGVKACRRDGIPVKGYFYWSLMDNFEWQKGYSMTFGLCAVDRKTMVRTPKKSLTYLGSLDF